MTSDYDALAYIELELARRPDHEVTRLLRYLMDHGCDEDTAHMKSPCYIVPMEYREEAQQLAATLLMLGCHADGDGDIYYTSKIDPHAVGNYEYLLLYTQGRDPEDEIHLYPKDVLELLKQLEKCHD